MPRPLSFANIVSVLALVVALAGSGYAVAAGELGKNTVGSKQLQKNAVRSADIKDGQVTGDDVDEASLGSVPSAGVAGTATTAGSAGTATTAGKVTGVSFTPVVTGSLGQPPVLVATKGPLSLQLSCVSSEVKQATLQVRTAVNGAAVSARPISDADDNLTVGEVVQVGYAEDSTPTFRRFEFAARTPGGETWQGQGWISVTGSVCSTQMLLLG